MTRIFPITGLVLAATLTFSCASSKEGNRRGVAVQVADVFVNDSHRGATPGTIRVYRGRKELSVSLRQGNTTVRSFKVEEYYSQNTAEVLFSVSGTQPDDMLTFTVEDLPSRDKLNYVIPFSEDRIRIEDNQFGLTIIVVD